MPIYEYRCQAGHVSERVISIQGIRPKTIQCHTEGCEMVSSRIFSTPHIAPVKGISNKIGRQLEERAELGSKRKAEWE